MLSYITTEHAAIRRWIEERRGHPAALRSTGGLRIYFPGYSSGERIDLIDWARFYREFEDARLAFLHQDRQRDGTISRFYQFVSR